MGRVLVSLVAMVWAVDTQAATLPPPDRPLETPSQIVTLVPLAFEVAAMPARGCCTTGNLPDGALKLQLAILSLVVAAALVPTLRRPALKAQRPVTWR